MLKPSDFKVGDIVTIQPLPRQEGLYLYQHQDFGLPARVMTYHTVPAFQAKVLVVTDKALICEGKMMQSGMTQWVRDACKAAGIPEDVRVDLGYYPFVEKFMTKSVIDLIQSMR